MSYSGSAPPLEPTWPEIHQQQRAAASSPALGVDGTGMKRPLSPFSAAIEDAKAPKRARGEAQGPTCLHCGCDSHRWVSCPSIRRKIWTHGIFADVPDYRRRV